MEIQLSMNELTTFLSNPVVDFIGYILSLIAATIAIYQALAKGKALKAIKQLNLQITTIRQENNDFNRVLSVPPTTLTPYLTNFSARSGSPRVVAKDFLPPGWAVLKMPRICFSMTTVSEILPSSRNYRKSL